MEEKNVKKLEYSLDTIESRGEFIKNEESGLYGGKNEDGEDVVVGLEEKVAMTIKTFQNNGWVRVDDYDGNGLLDSSTYEGRWNK